MYEFNRMSFQELERSDCFRGNTGDAAVQSPSESFFFRFVSKNLFQDVKAVLDFAEVDMQLVLRIQKRLVSDYVESGLCCCVVNEVSVWPGFRRNNSRLFFMTHGIMNLQFVFPVRISPM